MIGIISCVVAILLFAFLAAYLCNTSDRRINYVESEKLKRERDLMRWL